MQSSPLKEANTSGPALMSNFSLKHLQHLNWNNRNIVLKFFGSLETFLNELRLTKNIFGNAKKGL